MQKERPENCNDCIFCKKCKKTDRVSNSYKGLECANIWSERKILIKQLEKAKSILKKGDKIRVTKCPGTKRTITFDHWDGWWIVSKSGIDDYSFLTIDKLNGDDFSFKLKPK